MANYEEWFNGLKWAEEQYQEKKEDAKQYIEAMTLCNSSNFDDGAKHYIKYREENLNVNLR